MVKEKSILIRVSEEDKKQLQDAANVVGRSLTTFMVEAARKEALRLARRPEVRGEHRGVPAWFRGICQEAALGGGNGYEDAGYRLARALATEIPADVDHKQWSVAVEMLKDSLAAPGDDEEVWYWFTRRYPKFMELVVPRRRARFIYGVRRAYEDGCIEA
jgi:hypothetical protein